MEKARINFNARIRPIKPLNNEFTLCKCYVMALGKNRNKSIISKEAADGAIETLFNVPVVGHVFVDDDGNHRMGGHDIALEKDESGKLKHKVLTVPFGVVPENNNIAYEEVVESNGETKTYMVADVILWTDRYPQLKEAIYNDNLWFGQSMEIKAHEVVRGTTESDKDFIHINKFSFSGLCLLGKSDDENFDYSPCFPEAKVVPYNFELDNEQALNFETMREKLKHCFDDKNIKEENDEVAKKDNEKDYQSTETKRKCLDMPLNAPITHESGENDEKGDGEGMRVEGAKEYQFATTYNAKREAISSALYAMRVYTDEVYLTYSLADFDDKFVYVERLFINDEHPSGVLTKGRMSYEVDANEVATIDIMSFENMVVKWLTVAESVALDNQREQLEILTTWYTEHKERKIEQKNECFSTSKSATKIPIDIGKKTETTKNELHDEFMEKYLVQK